MSAFAARCDTFPRPRKINYDSLERWTENENIYIPNGQPESTGKNAFSVGSRTASLYHPCLVFVPACAPTICCRRIKRLRNDYRLPAITRLRSRTIIAPQPFHSKTINQLEAHKLSYSVSSIRLLPIFEWMFVCREWAFFDGTSVRFIISLPRCVRMPNGTAHKRMGYSLSSPSTHTHTQTLCIVMMMIIMTRRRH